MKMRKALSFVLVLALVLGSFSMVFATEGVKQGTDLSDISGNANYDAIVANSDLGIITGYTDGSFKPANAVNRAEFAAMITRMMGVPDSALAGYSSTNFTDMAGYGWANSYVGFCAAKGIVTGYGNGTFAPGATITVNEAVTMVLRAVGYVSNSNELVGTWPSNYVTLGKRLGLYDDVAATTTVDRASAAQVIYNALTCVVVAVNADGDTKAAYTEGSGDNYYEKNVLEVYLDCELYGDDLDKDGFAVYTYDAASNSVINTMAYVGAYVKAFANDDGDVVAIAESKSTFLTGKYDVDDEEFKVGDTVYTLTEKNMEKAQAALVNMKDITPLDGDKNPDIDANSVDKDATGIDSLFNTYAAKTGTVTIAADVSGKTIKEVYSIHKWVATEAFFYEKDMLEDDNLYGYDFDLNNDNAIDNGKFQLNGAKALSDIAEDNIIEVFTVGNSDSADIARVDVGTKTVEGKITMIDDGDYTIGGTVYGVADVVASNEKDSIPTDSGDTGTAYLSFRGEIAGWELEDAASDNYAIVSGKYMANGRDYTIMLVDKTGTEKEYVIKDAVGATDSGPNYSDETGGTFADASNLNVGDLVTFGLDKNGKIDELNAIAKFNGGTSYKDKQVNKNRTLFDNKTLDSGVVVFSYDENTVGASDFDVIALKDLEAEKDFSDAEGAFYYAKDGKIKAMLVPDKYTGAESIYAVINKAKKAVNDDDDDVLYVEGIANGEKFKKYTDDSSYADLTSSYDITANRTQVFELTLNAAGVITDAEKMNPAGDSDHEAAVIDGTVADKSGNYLIQVGSAWLTLDPNVKVYTYDEGEKEFTVSKVGDIYDGSGNKNASVVSVWQADDDSEVYDVVIIKKAASTTGGDVPTVDTMGTVTYIGATSVIIDSTEYDIIGSAAEFFGDSLSLNDEISYELSTGGNLFKITAVKPASGTLTLDATTPYAAFSGLTVDGDLAITGAAAITASNVTVTGDLTVAAASTLNATNFVVEGNTTINGTATFNSELKGDVTVASGATAAFTNVEFGADVEVASGATAATFTDSTIAGNLDVNQAGVTSFVNTVTVTGTITNAIDIDVTGADTATQEAVEATEVTEALAEVTLVAGATDGTVALDNSNEATAAAVEYSTDGTTWTDLAKNATSADIAVDAGDTIEVRVDAAPTAATKTFTVELADIKAAAAPVVTFVADETTVTTGFVGLNGSTTAMEYRYKNAGAGTDFSAWMDITAADQEVQRVNDTAAQADDVIEIRVKATTDKPASEITVLTVAAGDIGTN